MWPAGRTSKVTTGQTAVTATQQLRDYFMNIGCGLQGCISGVTWPHAGLCGLCDTRTQPAGQCEPSHERERTLDMFLAAAAILILGVPAALVSWVEQV